MMKARAKKLDRQSVEEAVAAMHDGDACFEEIYAVQYSRRLLRTGTRYITRTGISKRRSSVGEAVSARRMR